jgi:hypothetical protein
MRKREGKRLRQQEQARKKTEEEAAEREWQAIEKKAKAELEEAEAKELEELPEKRKTGSVSPPLLHLKTAIPLVLVVRINLSFHAFCRKSRPRHLLGDRPRNPARASASLERANQSRQRVAGR